MSNTSSRLLSKSHWKFRIFLQLRTSICTVHKLMFGHRYEAKNYTFVIVNCVLYSCQKNSQVKLQFEQFEFRAKIENFILPLKNIWANIFIFNNTYYVNRRVLIVHYWNLTHTL